MAPNDREERRRMRQRGAGTTGVSIGNFGFTFGGPALPAQPSGRRTPRALPSQPSSRRTPSANPLPAQPSTRRTPASTTSRRTSNAKPLSAQRSSRKSPVPPSSRASSRRTFKQEPTEEGSLLSQPSAGRQRRSKTPSQQDEQTVVTPSVTGKRKRPSALEVPQESQEDELEQNDEQHQASARKEHVDSARRTSRRGKDTPKIVLEEEEDELEENDADHTLSTEKRPRTSLGNAGSARAAASPSLFMSQDEPSPLPAVKRPGRPRKSVGGPPSTVAEPQETAATKKPRRSSRAERILDNLAEEEQEEVEDDFSADELTPAVARRQLERIEESESDLGASDSGEEEADDSEDEVASRASTPEASSSNIPPQPKRRSRPSMPKAAAPVPKPRKTLPAPKAPARKRPRRSSEAPERGARIPVTVYRLSTLRKPATDDASQIDELELPTPSAVANPRLPAVNAVDILAQITSELTTRMSTSLIQQAAAAGTTDKSRRAELTRRARTVDAFAIELADRLFELTEAVDAGEALRARAKAAAKEKVALRAEFLGIRKERDEVALRTDAVRRAHMEAEARRRRDEELSDALWGIETAVQRGREKAVREGREGEGPAGGLRWEVEDVVGGGVSGAAGGGGGLLERVREFNGFLERAAGVVEGRS